MRLASGTAKSGNEGDSARPRRGGPRTARGRRAVAQNATSHGVLNQSPVVAGESPKEWKAHLRGFRESLQPRDYYQDSLVIQAAEASFKLRRLDGFERGVIENQVEAVDDSDVEHAAWSLEAPEFAEIWLEANASGALSIFPGLLEREDQSSLPLEVGVPALLAVFQAAGTEVWTNWPGVASLYMNTLHSQDVTIARLQCLVKAVSSRKGQPADAFLEHCTRVLVEGAGYSSDYQLRMLEARTRKYREAIIPNERALNNIMRYRASLERTRDRAIARLEEAQLASTGSLPPPVRIDLQGQ